MSYEIPMKVSATAARILLMFSRIHTANVRAWKVQGAVPNNLLGSYLQYNIAMECLSHGNVYSD